MVYFSIYTYRFVRIIQSDYNQEPEGSLPSGCTDEDWEKRQDLFSKFLEKRLPQNKRIFASGRSTYVYETVFIKDDVAIMKFGRLPKMKMADVQLDALNIEDYPWCYVLWDNREGMQRMLVEQKPEAWSNTKTTIGTNKVAKAIREIIDDWLSKKGMYFEFGDGPVYKSEIFWEYVKSIRQGISRVHFSFPPPNLGRLMSLVKAIEDLNKETNGGLDVDMVAPKGSKLSLSPGNPHTESLIDFSSACGAEIKIYPKDGKTVIRISGNRLENDVVIEIDNSLFLVLNNQQSFQAVQEKFNATVIDILNKIKNHY